jgi:hypothetical protein
MHFGAPQEIFTDGRKNLWAGIVQRYLEKIGTLHKEASPNHPRTNGKVECWESYCSPNLQIYGTSISIRLCLHAECGPIRLRKSLHSTLFMGNMHIYSAMSMKPFPTM